MKFALLLLAVHLFAISCKTINYPGFCPLQAQRNAQARRDTQNPYETKLHDIHNENDKHKPIFKNIEAIQNGDPTDVFDIKTKKETTINDINGRINQEEIINNDKITPDSIKVVDKNEVYLPPLSHGLHGKTKGKSRPLSSDDKETISNNKTATPKDIKTKTVQDGDLSDVDITNIRELREQLLDHLLDYFINIIKEEEQFTETRKRNTKDKMKVEDKLRNYYSPAHLNDIQYLNESDYIDKDLDANGRRKGNDIIVNVKNITKDTTKLIELPKPIKVNKTIKYVTNDTIENNLNNTEIARNRDKELGENATEAILTPNKNASFIDNELISNPDMNKTKKEIKKSTTPKDNSKNDEILKKNTSTGTNTTIEKVKINNQTTDNNLQTLQEGKNVENLEVSERNTTENGGNIDINKAILIHKNCDHNTHKQIELINKEMPEENCKNNIILQFNINM